MSEPLRVYTNFQDLAELATGLTDRVTEEQLILYGPNDYATGEQIDFFIHLADETPALEGQASVAESIDGGEDRPPEIRFDVVLEAMQFSASNEVIFERILLARESEMNGDPPTGTIDLSEVDEVVAEDDYDYAEPSVEAAVAYPGEEPVAEYAEAASAEYAEAAPAEFEAAPEYAEAAAPVEYEEAPLEYAEAAPEGGYEEIPAEPYEDGQAYAGAEELPAVPADLGEQAFVSGEGEYTSDLDISQLEAMPIGEAAPAPPQPPASAPPIPPQQATTLGEGLLPPEGQLLLRPTIEPVWRDDDEEEDFVTGEPTGYFVYEEGPLPAPERPPHPALDPEFLVTPAPRPGDPVPVPAALAHAVAAPAAEEFAEDGYTEAGEAPEEDYAEGGEEGYAEAGQEYAEPAQEYAAEGEYAEPAAEGYAEEGYAEAAQEYAEPAQEGYAEAAQEYAEPAQEGYAEAGEQYAEAGEQYAEPAQEYAEPAQEYAEPAQEGYADAAQEYAEPAQEGYADPYAEAAQPATDALDEYEDAPEFAGELAPEATVVGDSQYQAQASQEFAVSSEYDAPNVIVDEDLAATTDATYAAYDEGEPQAPAASDSTREVDLGDFEAISE